MLRSVKIMISPTRGKNAGDVYHFLGAKSIPSASAENGK